MANTVVVSEYSGVAEDGRGQTIPLIKEPALRVTTLDFTSGSQNMTFHPSARYVRLWADTLCFYRFTASPGTAVTTDTPLDANDAVERGFDPGITSLAVVGA